MRKFIVVTILTILTASCGGGGGGGSAPHVDESTYRKDDRRLHGTNSEIKGVVRFDMPMNERNERMSINLCPAGARVISHGDQLSKKEARRLFEAYLDTYLKFKNIIAHEVVRDEDGLIIEGRLGRTHNGFTLGGYDKRPYSSESQNAYADDDGEDSRDWRRERFDRSSDRNSDDD